MNYINHMNDWYAKAYEDNRLHTTHFALYMALFQFWNLNRFQNPMSISREEVMRLSKIGSKNTYTRCLKELDKWGYLIYEPSFSPLVGSKIHLLTFDKGANTGDGKGGGNAAGQLVVPFIKHNKLFKHNKQGDKNFNKYDEPL